jgi:DNA polymerase-1
MTDMANKKKILYLVDGTSYIHRAYHAIRNLANSKGLPTNAIYGFTKMVLKLIAEKEPEYLVVVFDSKGPTFRHEMYAEYKANRPPMPEDLVTQLPYIKLIVEGLNLPTIEKQGFEADDLIGTLACRSEKQGFEVVIVSGDKDFRQLISPKTSQWDTMKDKFTDYAAIEEEYGLKPEQFIDVMGLSGDTSDNVPGVSGVGEKTAIELIKQFGSLEAVFHKVEEIERKKLKENLLNSREAAELSKKLVTIDCQAPIAEDIQDLKIGEPDSQKLSALFQELEFRALWEQFTTRKDVTHDDYHLLFSRDELESLIRKIKKAKMVSVDTETTSEDPLKAELVGISFSLEPHQAYYLPLGHRYLGAPVQLELRAALDMLRPVLEDAHIKKIGQNIKYDALIFRNYQIDLQGLDFDTMIASYVINPGLRQHNLDYLAQHYLHHKMIPFEEMVGKGKNQRTFDQVDVEQAKVYSCEDADMTLQLRAILEEQLKKDLNQDLFYDLEMKLIPVLMDMEAAGIKIDVKFFQEMSKRFAKQLKEIESQVYAEAGMEFNINSPQQVGVVLFEKLQLPLQKKTLKTKTYSTDVKVLKQLASDSGGVPHPMPKLLLRYRTLTKLKSTYLDALIKIIHPRTGRVHTSFNQTVTATGRLSSSNPNLQNIPIRGEEGREIRKGFIAENGCLLLSSDYSQIELRVFAHYSNDKGMIRAFENELDIHASTAAEIMGVALDGVKPDMRRIAKAINFGIIYGMGPQKLSEELGIDLKTAKEYIARYYERYQGVVRYREEMVASAREKGYVTTLFNRRRYLPDIQHQNRIIQSEAERMAINTPIQGTAADLIKKAMIRIHDRLKEEKLGTRLLLQVHDELVFEVPEREMKQISMLVREEMEGVHKLRVPLKVDIKVGVNWDEAH